MENRAGCFIHGQVNARDLSDLLGTSVNKKIDFPPLRMISRDFNGDSSSVVKKKYQGTTVANFSSTKRTRWI